MIHLEARNRLGSMASACGVGKPTREDTGPTRPQSSYPPWFRAVVILWTDDTAAAFADLTAAGAPLLASLHEWLGRQLIAWIADPDRNPVQIVQHL